MKCTNCSTELISGAKYCAECGYPVSGGKPGKVMPWDKIILVSVILAGIVGASLILFPDHNPVNSQQSVVINNTDAHLQLEKYLGQLKQSPNDIELLTKVGNFYFDSNSFTNALVYYNRILQQQPDNIEVIIDAGVCSFNQGQIDEAKRKFEYALSLEPGHPVGLYNLGIVFSNKGQHEKAAEIWHKILNVAPDSPQADAIREMLNTETKKNKS